MKNDVNQNNDKTISDDNDGGSSRCDDLSGEDTDGWLDVLPDIIEFIVTIFLQ